MKLFQKAHFQALYQMIIVSFIFSLLYYFLGKDHLIYSHDLDIHVNYFDCLYFSVIIQSLLGTGEIIPRSMLMKGLVILQILTSLVINFMY
jgi:hypothetical protein